MSKIQQYLEAFKSKDNITHTAYGAFNGMYSIPGEKLPELYKDCKVIEQSIQNFSREEVENVLRKDKSIWQRIKGLFVGV